ncbi:DUF1804 family protein [Phreatobacter stygius]|uniref:DUF1804 family protein n=1 Tax=Phreatobacter stygius TaxID=1940610 RepID=A0A4D7BC64_9HYPH|nr:DUF1804 family protein [Phreatobacter stygius]QCI65642.1 DUF1804 family protein [Phreatobacter stygius]
MAHDDRKKRDARKKYVFERQALPVVALTLGVPEATLRRWKREAGAKGDDWDTARSANTIAGEGLDKLITEVVQDYVTVHQATIEDLRTQQGLTASERAKILAGLADSFNKTVSAAGRISPKISELGVAMDVLKRFAEFVTRQHPKLAPPLLEVIEPFGQHLAEVYG